MDTVEIVVGDRGEIDDLRDESGTISLSRFKKRLTDDPGREGGQRRFLIIVPWSRRFGG